MKTNSILLGMAFLAMAGSGVTHSQTPFIGKPQLTAAQTVPADVPSQYVLRHHGALGANHPFPGTVSVAPAVSDVGPEEAAASDALREQGEAEMKKGNLSAARNDYDQALSIWPDSKPNLYAAAECAVAASDLNRALKYYRAAIYASDPAHSMNGFQENDVSRLMQFASVLSRAGQIREGIFVYNRAAYLLDYEDSEFNRGKPTLTVPLPKIVAEDPSPSQVQYTSAHLQALVDTALAHQNHDVKEERAQIEAAVKLYPDSPVTHYYQGEFLSRANDPSAKAAFQKAVELGDENTGAAAKERLSVYP